MNRDRKQIPYAFSPPKYSPVFGPLLRWISRRFFLKGTFRIRTLEVEGIEAVAALAARGHSLLIAPNHADHADPSVLVETARRNGCVFHYMAAREGFERGPISRWVLQHLGAFSVDREGNDLSAVRTAMQLVQQGTYPLVIFPEGEIWHHHEVLDELNEGVATIVLRASNKVAEGKRCYLVPTALQYTYDPSVETSFDARLTTLEQRIAWKPRPDLPAVDRIYRLGEGILALKEAEFLGASREGDLIDRLHNFQEELLAHAEARHQVNPADERVPVRAKQLRLKIRQSLTDPEHALPAEEVDALYDDLDRIFAAIQAYSYPGDYLRADPSIHRIAETLLKLEEDLLDAGAYPAPRDVCVRFGEPIEIAAFLEAGGYTVKTAVEPLTREMGQRIQALFG
ncbi:MAG: 1-acyl-sn-glycerol-3-phosphate acyltransferase [Candidatus Omnitrophota bacterium]|jgi:1-acyl-sn-glycerol-3-phosphate acyltransferase